MFSLRNKKNSLNYSQYPLLSWALDSVDPDQADVGLNCLNDKQCRP